MLRLELLILIQIPNPLILRPHNMILWPLSWLFTEMLHLKFCASDGGPHSAPRAENPPDDMGSFSWDSEIIKYAPLGFLIVLQNLKFVVTVLAVLDIDSTEHDAVQTRARLEHMCLQGSVQWKKTCPDLVSNLVLHTRLWVNVGSSLQLQLQSLRSTGYKPVGWERILLLNEKADRLIVCRESFKIFRL